MRKLKSVSLLLIVILFLSCTGSDGEMGPPGLNGTNGVDGTDGTNGVDGEDGNANVFASDWILADPWTNFGSYYRFFLEAPEVTQEIRNSGIVLVYYRPYQFESNAVFALPMSLYGGTLTYILITGRIQISVLSPNSGPFNTRDYFRYIVIESSALASSKTTTTKEALSAQLNDAGVDINNFDDVLSYFGKQ